MQCLPHYEPRTNLEKVLNVFEYELCFLVLGRVLREERERGEEKAKIRICTSDEKISLNLETIRVRWNKTLQNI